MADLVSKSWFCIFNNPELHGYPGTPEEICNSLMQEWTLNEPKRSGYWAYCISAEGLKHVHMVLEDIKSMRWTAVKASYALGMHFVPTKGTKKEVLSYIRKEGKFEEKGEEVVYTCQFGDVVGHQGKSGVMLDAYDRMLEDNISFSSLLKENPLLYKDYNMYRQMECDIMAEKICEERKVEVVWHYGLAGSGKSYSVAFLQDVYRVTHYKRGLFDYYNYNDILVLDEFRGQIPYAELLSYLDIYKCQLPCRYANKFARWSQVHVVSVLSPKEVYDLYMLDESDSFEQLLRRITTVMYHYKDFDIYRAVIISKEDLKIPMKHNLDDLIKLAVKGGNYEGCHVRTEILGEDVNK